MTRRLGILFILLSVCVAVSRDSFAQGGKAPIRYGDTAQFVAEGAAKGMLMPTLVAIQQKKAAATWKRIFNEDDSPNLETPHFLVHGVIAGKTLKEVGANLEKQYALAIKTLELEQEEPWIGKLTVFCLPERSGFLNFIRAIQQRRLDEDDHGTFDIDDEFPYVAASPHPARPNSPADYMAGEMMAAALTTKKAGRNVPEWIQGAFGRATVFRAAPPKELAAEHKRAVAYLVKNKRTLKEVVPPGSVMDEEAVILRASLLEYLAYSGRTAKFLPFLNGFRPVDEKTEPGFAAGLTAANLTQDRLDQVWQTWLKTVK